MFIDRRMFNHFNYHLLTVTLLILCAGLMVLYSAGYNPDSVGVPLGPFSITVKSVAFARQFAFMGMGLVALVIGMSLSSQNLYRVAYPLYVLTLGLLIAVLLFGTVSNGSRRWFSILGFRFQPSEFVKVAVILVMARYLSKVKLPNGGFRLKNLILPALIVLVPMGLIIKQPDLGTGLVIGAIGAGMLLFVGINTKTLAVLVISGVIAIIPVWHSLHDYQKRRVLTLVNPAADPLGSGYHLNQSKIAVGSGAFLGKGYLKGTQTQLEFLPEHTTDFVFSVLAEEWGFVGSFIVICLYGALILLLLGIAYKSRDTYASLVVIGVTSYFLFHIVTNIAMVIGMMPVVGITLPFFSYGGSSVIVSLFCMGIVLGVSMRRYQFGQS